MQVPNGARNSPMDEDREEYRRDESRRSRKAGGPMRRRTRRACDNCNFSRTRCDGLAPCQRCLDYGNICHYNRTVKKRGRVPSSLRRNPPRPAVDVDPEQNSPSKNKPEMPHHNQYDQQSQEDTHHTSPSGLSSILFGEDTLSPCSSRPGQTPLLQLLSLDHDHDHAPRASLRTGAEPHNSIITDPTRLERGNRQLDGIAGSSSSVGSTGSDQSGTRTPWATENQPVNTKAIGLEQPSWNPESSILSEDCRYPCLKPILPYLRDIVPASVVCDLLDVYFIEPGTSLFRCTSSYVLTPVIRKKSLLDASHCRPTTSALLVTMLWCAAQTADLVLLHVPGSRSKLANALYDLATSLIAERDPDGWRRIHGGLCVENTSRQSSLPYSLPPPTTTATNEPAGVIDDVLTFTLLSIAVSGGDFKSDCFKWWSKAVRLAFALRLNTEDERQPSLTASDSHEPTSSHRVPETETMRQVEIKEERRRMFWLLYCLDRHFALSFNGTLHIPDSCCEVYVPLPDTIWENLDTMSPSDLPPRMYGPFTIVSGTGFFEYFLPLMAILGDIVEIHHRKNHPRFGGLGCSHTVTAVADMLLNSERSLENLSNQSIQVPSPMDTLPVNSTEHISLSGTPSSSQAVETRKQLVIAYSSHIIHVLYVLLYGKWDALAMLDDEDDWITSPQFVKCASHAIAASHAVLRILQLDPELMFMPYLFGIYLLHGSFILLLFADRMPQLGPNESVEQACETIIRAHEVCVVTLSTEFQRNFRKVLRSTLYSVRGCNPTDLRESKARRRVLSLYRWTKGAKGLAL